MPSSKSFFFPDSPIVAPVVCSVCGKNAPCVRRQANGAAELQTFLCECGNTEVLLRGSDVSDAAIQTDIERRIQGGKV